MVGGTGLDFELDGRHGVVVLDDLAGRSTSTTVATGAGSGLGQVCEYAFSSVMEVLNLPLGSLALSDPIVAFFPTAPLMGLFGRVGRCEQ